MLNVITREDAFLQSLQIRFSGQFQKRYENQNAHVVKAVVARSLNKLTDDQFNQGMARLDTSRYCPDLAEFEAWCVSGFWQSANEAWQRASEWSNQSDLDLQALSELTPEEFLKSKVKITVLTKTAWDSVYWMVEQGDMRNAFRQFKSIYEDYVSKAQMVGKQQEWYVPPRMLGTSTPVYKGVPNKYMEKLSDEDKAISNLTVRLMKTGKSWKDAFHQAQMEIKGSVGSINKLNSGGAA